MNSCEINLTTVRGKLEGGALAPTYSGIPRCSGVPVHVFFPPYPTSSSRPLVLLGSAAAILNETDWLCGGRNDNRNK